MARVNQTKLQSKANSKQSKSNKNKTKPMKVQPFRKKLTLSTEQAEKLLKKIKFEKDKIEKELKAFDQNLQENDSVINRLKEGKEIYSYNIDYTTWPWDGASNLPGIIIPTAVDATRANIQRAQSVDPPSRAVNEKNTDIANLKEIYIQDELRYQIPNNKQVILSWLHSSILHGVGWIKHFDRITKKRKRARRKFDNLDDFESRHDRNKFPDLAAKLEDGESISVIESEEVFDYEHIIEWVDPENMLISKYTKDINNSTVLEKIQLTPEELIEQGFDNIDLMFNTDEEISRIETLEEKFEVIQAELFFDIKGNGRREKILAVVSLDKEAILLTERHPNDNGHSIYIPTFIQPYLGNFWRQGFYDKLRAVHQTHKEIVDVILNSAYISFIPSFKAKRNGSFDPTIQDWFPGVTWFLDNLDDVVQWDIRPSQINFSEWADRTQQFGFEISGVSPYNQGTPLSSGESGEKIKTLLAAGGIRLEEMIISINEGFNELYFQILETAKKRNPIFNQIRPDFEGDVSVFDEGNEKYKSALEAENTNPDAIFQRNITVRELMVQDPSVAQSPQHITEFSKQILRTAGAGWESKVNQVIPTPEEIQEQQIQIQMEAMKRLEQERLQQEAEQISKDIGPEAKQEVMDEFQGGEEPPIGL
jgi:hypothetical protein